MQQMQLMLFPKNHLVNSWDCKFPKNIFSKTHKIIVPFLENSAANLSKIPSQRVPLVHKILVLF